MSDASSRDRRRIGDETLSRIEGLADGWSSGSEAGDSNPPGADTEPVAKEDAEALLAETKPSEEVSTRAKRRSHPPPPPRPNRSSAPPPPPPPKARAAPPTAPPPVPSAAAAKPAAPPRPEPAVIVASDEEASDDPTVLAPPSDALKRAKEKARATGAAATVRESKAVPYRQGLIGDVGYVFAVLGASLRARRERDAAERRLEVERKARTAELLAMARQAIVDDTLRLASVERVRAVVADIEEVRGKRQGSAAAAESEIEGLQAARKKAAEAAKTRIDTISKDIAGIEQRLVPLDKQVVEVRDRAAAVKKQLAAIDRQITTTEGSLVSVKDRDKAANPGAVEVELAVLRAERDGVAREQPQLAADLADIEPQVASLNAHRNDKRALIDELRAAEIEADARLAEEVAAVLARKAVEDRAVADADKKRDKALVGLGEDLCIDRPQALLPALRGIDDHDASIAELERSLMEVGELLGGIRRGAVIRGCAILALVFAAVIAGGIYIVL